jgi:hypothetical protein
MIIVRLTSHLLFKFVAVFIDEDVDGDAFLQLTFHALRDYKMKLGHAVKVSSLVKQLLVGMFMCFLLCSQVFIYK